MIRQGNKQKKIHQEFSLFIQWKCFYINSKQETLVLTQKIYAKSFCFFELLNMTEYFYFILTRMSFFLLQVLRDWLERVEGEFADRWTDNNSFVFRPIFHLFEIQKVNVKIITRHIQSIFSMTKQTSRVASCQFMLWICAILTHQKSGWYGTWFSARLLYINGEWS